MIIKVRNSRFFKGISVMLCITIIAETINPSVSWGLTGGPSQPEFSEFTPIGVSDMVDLSSGDVSYNIPLMDIGGYPINIAYNGGSGMDEEASMVGLGWNLAIGQINRNVRGIPDDFKGDQLTYENYVMPNVTAGADLQINPAIAGVDFLDVNFGVSAVFNSYAGFTMSPSVGIGIDLGNNASVGFNVKSGEDGLSVSPNFSIHANTKTKNNRNNQLGANVGVSWNSRNGVSQMTMGVTNKTKFTRSSKNLTRSGNQRIDGSQSLGSSISFAEQLYTPSRRVGMQTGSFTVNAALGGEVYTVEVQGQITGYGTAMIVAPSERSKSVGAYGYINTEHGDEYSVLDFNREKDGNYSTSTTNLAVTNYTYDVYSVQGQGVSGVYRPFRNQVGFVYDARVDDGSLSGAMGLEVGGGNSVHLGSDFEMTMVESHSGEWKNNNYHYQSLEEVDYSGIMNYERVHYKNVGDLSSDKDFNLFNETGGYDPIRIPFEGGDFNRYAVNELNKKNYGNLGEAVLAGGVKQRHNRQARNQAIITLTKSEVQGGIGYGPIAYGEIGWSTDDSNDELGQNHHSAEVQIIRNDGARYIYGLPAYNHLKREATFAVDKSNGDNETGLVSYDQNANNPVTLGGMLEWTQLPNDQYFNRVTTPDYVHTHMLTSILSTDYSDISDDGPTPDDYGSYTKFSYQSYFQLNGNEKFYRWRVPYNSGKATYNEGLKTDHKDDQGSYEYGEKELYFINKIETKTHIAVFHQTAREDAKGVLGENGGLDVSQNSYKLDSICLYSIGEYYDINGQPIQNATPIKVVHFEYSYSLCPGIENNAIKSTSYVEDLDENELSNFGGKLTLKKVYFTYRNSKMGKYTGYKFNYREFTSGLDEYSPNQPTLVLNTQGNNPSYHIKGYDSWGNYKPVGVGGNANTDAPTNSEFHYTNQNRTEQDLNSQAWNLKKIKLPSGGEINIEYESDSYSNVQDKDIMGMFKVVGTGTDPTTLSIASGDCGELFDLNWSATPFNCLYVQIDGEDHSSDPSCPDPELFIGNLDRDLINFRFFVNTTDLGGTEINDDNAHFDYVSGYAQVDLTGATTFCTTEGLFLSVPLVMVNRDNNTTSIPHANPISKATWNYARKFLSKYAYGTQPNTSSDEIEDIVNQMVNTSMFNNLLEIFKGPNGVLETKLVGRRFVKERSWVRLKDPSNEKLGGGYRVSKITMNDKWNLMTGSNLYQEMNYGQEYIYTKSGEKEAEDIIGSNDRDVSSGVATYEPIGNKENPFVRPVFTSTDRFLAPDEENYMEEPFGESFFPSPQVTYSKVTVKSLTAGTHPTETNVKPLHKTGKVVTEFYTSKDFPTIVDNTIIQDEEDKADALDNLLGLSVKQHMTMSQGYVIHVNDMNGKQKSQRVYAEGQDSYISGVDYIYSTNYGNSNFSTNNDPNQNRGRLNNKVKVIHPDFTVSEEVIGVETDIVHDLRENATKTEIAGVNTNLAAFLASVVPVAIPIPLPDYSKTENQFRAISTTKVINTFGILKETIAYDAGAAVYTKNLAWDSETGEVLVTETVDEFNDRYYTMNYPAHWKFDGMGQASQNVGMEGVFYAAGVAGNQTETFVLSPISPLIPASEYFLPGDEIVLRNMNGSYLNTGWVTLVDNNLQMVDATGQPITATSADYLKFKVIRSGHRNLQSAGIMNVTLMVNPLDIMATTNVSSFLETSNWLDYRIINAGAVDYSDSWGLTCECGISTGFSNYNSYRRNELGVWRTKASYAYLTGRNHLQDLVSIDPNATATPRMQGFFKGFSPLYQFDDYEPGLGSEWGYEYTGWTTVAEVTRYSPYGFELENKDALNRYSAAQYGYYNSFPMAVGANTKYNELGFDGFEDYGFDGCAYSEHFKFNDPNTIISTAQSHSGKHSIKVAAGTRATMRKKLSCEL